MKWKFGDFDKSTELSPDLEWMIQSGQVNRLVLLETLAEAYYLRIYQLALSLTNDTTAAQTILGEVFSYLVLNLHRYRSHIGVDIWIYQNAYRICMRSLGGERFWRGIKWWISSPGQFTNPHSVEPPSDFDRSLWGQIDTLEDTLKIPVVLRFANDWEVSLISRVMGLGEEEVAGRIRSGIQQIENPTGQSPEGMEPKLRASLHARWAPPDHQEISQFVAGVNDRMGRKHIFRRGMTTAKELLLVGLAILLILLVIWGGNRYILSEELLPLAIGSQDNRSQLEAGAIKPVQAVQATTVPVFKNQPGGGSPLSGLPTPTPTRNNFCNRQIQSSRRDRLGKQGLRQF